MHYAWIVLGGALLMLVGSGVRAVFGVFITPIEGEFHGDRASLSGVAAISILPSGALSPFTGWLADRWGPRRVIMVACALLAAGCMWASQVRAFWQLCATAGVLLGVGAAGVGMPRPRPSPRGGSSPGEGSCSGSLAQPPPRVSSSSSRSPCGSPSSSGGARLTWCSERPAGHLSARGPPARGPPARGPPARGPPAR